MKSPAQAFPPGEFLEEELEARDWDRRDLAKFAAVDIGIVNGIISDRSPVTPEIAKALGSSLGTSPEFWLNLEKSWIEGIEETVEGCFEILGCGFRIELSFESGFVRARAIKPKAIYPDCTFNHVENAVDRSVGMALRKLARIVKIGGDYPTEVYENDDE